MSQHLVEQRKKRIRKFLLPLRATFKQQIRNGEKPWKLKDQYIAQYCIDSGVRPTVAKKYLRLYIDTYTLRADDDTIKPTTTLLDELEKEIKKTDEADKRMQELLKQEKSEKKN